MHSNFTTPATEYLEASGVSFSIFYHHGDVKSVEQAAAERDQEPDQVVRSILFRLDESNFILVLMPGPNQINWKLLRSHLNKSRITMATPEEVLKITGYPIGAVCPFGLRTKLPILVDTSLKQQKEISLGFGRHSTALMMKTTDFLTALGPNFEWVNLKK